ncbi:hypothetical protein CLIB1423_17S01640 [[Candida] railenensis]|uniref:Uncharacterized protein n=1 Tax=[Candida] railenensis TaxID=45579 RepID=A0A9P0QT87_9ASCO|nr:hypothetical protein CLIB1423_17S01640 [[Candida] railenensis]
MQKYLFLASLVAIVSAATETAADDSATTDAAEYSIDYAQLSSLYGELANTQYLLSAYSAELEAVYGTTWSEAAAAILAEATSSGADQLALASSLADVYESYASTAVESGAITTPVESTLSDFSSQTNSVIETDSSADSSAASSGSASDSASDSSTGTSSSSGSSSTAGASSTGSSSSAGAQAIAVVPFVGTFAALLAALF